MALDRAGVILALGCTALSALSSCVSTVAGPGRVDDPASVHLYSSGRHAGLLLPCADGRVVEYGYGDWSWYALGEDEWWHALGTVLWPNAGTLGRRYLPSAELQALGGSGEIVVSRARADRLLARLDAEFAQGGEPHYNALLDMWFVRHEDDFWMFHDCHDATAQWLEELECSVSPAPIRGGLAVAAPAADQMRSK